MLPIRIIRDHLARITGITNKISRFTVCLWSWPSLLSLYLFKGIIHELHKHGYKGGVFGTTWVTYLKALISHVV